MKPLNILKQWILNALVPYIERKEKDQRAKWLFVLFIVALTGGYSYKVFSHTDRHECQIENVSHNYDPHHCKASEDLGCRG